MIASETAFSSSADILRRTRAGTHPECFACSPGQSAGLGVEFEIGPDGSVEGHFTPSSRHQGYSGWLHGGIISSLLDAAMTNALFARGIVAVTAEMTTRFLQPVLLDGVLSIRGWLKTSCYPLHLMEASLVQGDRKVAWGSAKFIEMDAAIQISAEKERYGK